jgi:drug/metabolite transporter (DMT)-like permease
MKNELQDYLDRPKRYDNIDGTGEMYMGLMILGFALLGYLQTILPKDSLWSTNGFASLLFMYLILIPVLALGYWGSRVIKKRLTWPRTGYVAPGAGGADAQAKRNRWAAMVALAIFSVVVGAGMVCLLVLARRHQAVSVARVGYLAFWVPLYAFWIWRMGGANRWKWLGLVVMALGLFVLGVFGPGDFIELVRRVMLFVGLVWFGSGAITLCLYLRHTQPPAPEAE